MDAAALTGKIDIETKKAESDIHSFGGKFNEAGGHVTSFIAKIGKLAVVGAGIGLLAGGAALLVTQLHSWITAGAQANRMTAATAQVLKTTHGAAGMTSAAVEALATKYSNLTGIDDDVVHSTENLLLTFTNLHKDVFPRATKAALDMATVLGTDTKTSAIQLGKALNDPERGITALTKAGVTFDQKQKDLIHTYMAHGEIAKAQAVIMKEVEKEFGGQAEAAGKANGGIKILDAQFHNMQQTIGQAVIPILLGLMTAISPVITQIGQWLPGAIAVLGQFITTQLAPVLHQLVTTFVTQMLPALIQFAHYVLLNVVPTLQKLWTWVGQHVVPIVLVLADIFLHNVLPAAQRVWESISQRLIPAVQKLWDKLSPLLIPILKALGTVLQTIVGPAISGVIDLISDLIDKIGGAIDKIGDLISKFNLAGFADNKDFQKNFHIPPGHASGTTFHEGGAFTGAEEGPELLLRPGIYMAPRGSRILSASDTRAALAGAGMGGASLHTTYNIYPQKAELDITDLARLQRRRELLGLGTGA